MNSHYNKITFFIYENSWLIGNISINKALQLMPNSAWTAVVGHMF